MNEIDGVYLPLITPFYRRKIDFKSLNNLIEYYIKSGISGLIPMATTGEIPTIDEDEYFRVIKECIDTVNGRVQLFAGLSGNCTEKMLKKLDKLSKYQLDGLLVTAPYYNLPSQEGIFKHFRELAENTEFDIVLYNIPYRTGRNVENETILELSEIRNIAGIKDSCGILNQSIELIRKRPEGFSVLTGEDIFFMGNLAYGGNGAILASAHIHPEKFVSVYRNMRRNNFCDALSQWNTVSENIPLLFEEPNPAPVKHILYRKKMIRSNEVRSPLCRITAALAGKLKKIITELD